jgi:hypothetical protein
MKTATAYEVEFRMGSFKVTEVPLETAHAPAGWETLRTLSSVRSYLRSWRPHVANSQSRETVRRFTEEVNLFTRADLGRSLSF